MELEKSLNIVGDYRLSTNVNAMNWCSPPATAYLGLSNVNTYAVSGILPEFDYTFSVLTASNQGANPVLSMVTQQPGSLQVNSFAGSLASSCFAMATNLETSNGVEISGLNAEEQSDIALIAQWKSAQVLGTKFTGASPSDGGPSNLEIYSYYDAMIILRENNVLELIQ